MAPSVFVTEMDELFQVLPTDRLGSRRAHVPLPSDYLAKHPLLALLQRCLEERGFAVVLSLLNDADAHPEVLLGEGSEFEIGVRELPIVLEASWGPKSHNPFALLEG